MWLSFGFTDIWCLKLVTKSANLSPCRKFSKKEKSEMVSSDIIGLVKQAQLYREDWHCC